MTKDTRLGPLLAKARDALVKLNHSEEDSSRLLRAIDAALRAANEPTATAICPPSMADDADNDGPNDEGKSFDRWAKLRDVDAAQLYRLATLLQRYETEAEAASACIEDVRRLLNGTEWTPETLDTIAERLREHWVE